MKPLQPIQQTLKWLALVSCMVLLGGCAMTRMIDSYVSSFIGTPAAVTNVGYRFERLPSQLANNALQDQTEALTALALERVGLARNDANAMYAVQITVRVEQTIRNPARLLRQSGFYAGADGLFWESAPSLFMEPPWYIHTVQLLLRDIQSGQIAYESTAVHDGPWSDTRNLLPAMLEAALRGYPNPPSGPRRVIVELPPEPGKVN
jgi:hypothetical protein